MSPATAPAANAGEEPVTDPGISLVKTADIDMTVVAPNDRIDPGDVITYSFTVENTGAIDLTDVTVVDFSEGVVMTGSPFSLAVGGTGTTTYSGTYVITNEDILDGFFECEFVCLFDLRYDVIASASVMVDINLPDVVLSIDEKAAPLGTPLGSELFVDEYFAPFGYTGDVTWQVTIANVSGYDVGSLLFDAAAVSAAVVAFEAADVGAFVNGAIVIDIEENSITFVFDGPGDVGTVNLAGIAGADFWGRDVVRVTADARVSALAPTGEISGVIFNHENKNGR